MKLDSMNVNGLALAAVAIAAAYIVSQIAKGAAAGADLLPSAARATGNAINPNSRENLINRAVTAVGQTVTADPEWVPGVSLWEWLNPDAVAAERAMVGPVKPAPTYDQRASPSGNATSGAPDQAWGAWLWEKLNPGAVAAERRAMGL